MNRTPLRVKDDVVDFSQATLASRARSASGYSLGALENAKTQSEIAEVERALMSPATVRGILEDDHPAQALAKILQPFDLPPEN